MKLIVAPDSLPALSVPLAADSVTVTDPVANYVKTVSGPAVTYTIYDDNLHTHLIAQLHVA